MVCATDCLRFFIVWLVVQLISRASSGISILRPIFSKLVKLPLRAASTNMLNAGESCRRSGGQLLGVAVASYGDDGDGNDGDQIGKGEGFGNLHGGFHTWFSDGLKAV